MNDPGSEKPQTEKTEKTEKPKIIVDEDWKSRVQAEREQLAQEQTAAGQSADAGAKPGAQPEEGTMPPASFAVLVTTLATQATVALGQAPVPGEDDKVMVNLPFAKHCIDTLEILADKTKGNLTTGEDRLLQQFLHELRMLFVSVQNQLRKQGT